MTVVYVKEQGAIVRKRGSQLVVEKEGETLAEILTRHTSAVSIFGNVQVTTQAMSEMLERGITLTLYTRGGRLKGHLVPEESKNVELRLAQFRAAFDAGRSLDAGRAVVRAKLLNSAKLLEDYRSNYAIAELGETIGELKRLAGTCAAAGAVDQLMGIEGAGAAAYFRVFAMLDRSPMRFDGRRKHPAPDPVNALLSLGYTFVLNELEGLLEGHGLDPYVGFLHVPDYGRPSLALDVLEAFRAPLVDKLTLTMLNEHVFGEEDFARRVSGPRMGSVVLLPGEFGKYIERYEAAVKDSRPGAPGGFRVAFAEEAAKLRKWLLDGTAWEPYLEA